MEEVYQMSKKELLRIKVLHQLREKHISQKAASLKLGISTRQVRNLIKRIEVEGDKGIISKKKYLRNNTKSRQFKDNVLKLVKTYYPDFGPKLASEYLKKNHNIDVVDETLRLWMIEAHLWVQRKRHKSIHLPRQRRGCFGELIQIDGSHHPWMEDRGPPCVLMVMIDDATSIITALHLSEEEDLEAYYSILAKHINTYGIPKAIYGDRCSVLTSRNSNLLTQTQFQKAAEELEISIILAQTPQAKGRVERANKTLQDRLVKLLRIKNVKTIEEANQILEEYRLEHNQYFSKKPSEQADAHRPLDGICLDHILCIRETRTLLDNCLVQFKNNFYVISAQAGNIHFYKGAKVEIRKLLDGKIIAYFKKKLVNITHLSEVEYPIMQDRKQVNAWKDKQHYIPSKDHPYKAFYPRCQQN